MADILTWYLGMGTGCLTLFAVWAARKRVVPAFIEDWLNPWTVVFAVLVWPVFLVSELFLNVPKQRRRRFEATKNERREAGERRELKLVEKREFDSVIGEQGVALTALRLGGFVEVRRRRWMAVSDDGFIEAGSKIVVEHRSGDELRVRRRAEPVDQLEQAVSSDRARPHL